MALGIHLRQNTVSALSDFTSPALIIPHLQGLDRMAVIGELAQAMKTDHRMPASSRFYQAVLNRELLASTEMGKGVAFPHARLPELKDLFFALGRCAQPLRWADTSPPRVRFVFLVAAPESDSGEYLRLISGLVRLAKEGRLINQMEAAGDASRIFEVLQQVKLAARWGKTEPGSESDGGSETHAKTTQGG